MRAEAKVVVMRVVVKGAVARVEAVRVAVVRAEARAVAEG